MGKEYEFDAIIKKADKVDGAYVEFPYDVLVEFGTKGRIKVKATFDGYEYKGILVKMGLECHIIGITKAIRNIIGKEPDDIIKVTIKEDNSSRLEEIPEDFLKLLKENHIADEFFSSLTDSQKNKFIKDIVSAKKEETRIKRIDKAINLLCKKEKM